MVHHQEYKEILELADQEQARTSFIKAREHRGLSQEWMAENAGYSLTQYERIENEERKISADDFWRIGQALLDYEDSLKSPIQRKLSGIRREIRSEFYDVPEYLAFKGPGEDDPIFRVRVRTLVFWSVFIIWSSLTRGTDYSPGFILGRLVSGIVTAFNYVLAMS